MSGWWLTAHRERQVLDFAQRYAFECGVPGEFTEDEPWEDDAQPLRVLTLRLREGDFQVRAKLTAFGLANARPMQIEYVVDRECAKMRRKLDEALALAALTGLPTQLRSRMPKRWSRP